MLSFRHSPSPWPPPQWSREVVSVTVETRKKCIVSLFLDHTGSRSLLSSEPRAPTPGVTWQLRKSPRSHPGVPARLCLLRDSGSPRGEAPNLPDFSVKPRVFSPCQGRVIVIPLTTRKTRLGGDGQPRWPSERIFSSGAASSGPVSVLDSGSPPTGWNHYRRHVWKQILTDALPFLPQK